MNDFVSEGVCDFCHKKKKFLIYDKMHGIDCPDQEGYFCFECRLEVGLIDEEDLDYDRL